MPITQVLTAAWIAAALASGEPEPAPPPPADIGSLVTRLGADDWATREAADAELRAVELPGLAPLMPYLVRSDLSPEQANRLRSIALDQFRHEPHAGMGVSWDPNFRFGAQHPSPVVIGQTVAGFDAASKLRPGDSIAAMDGMPLPSEREMRAAILSHAPGDVVSLTVFRGTLRLEVSLTLGDYAALQRTADFPSDDALSRALDLRLARLAPGGVVLRPRVVGGMTLAQWTQAGAHPVRPASVFMPGDDEELAALLVGGEAHGGWPNPLGGAEVRPTIRMAPSTRPNPERPTTAPVDPRRVPIVAPPSAPKRPAAQPPAPRPAPRPGA